MKTTIRFLILFLVNASQSWAATESSADAGLEGIYNYIEYSPTFSSAGQPTLEQFQIIADSGFERIVNIAFTTDPGGIPNADQVIKDLGIEYMQVPVSGENPLPADFYAFADSMQRDTSKKTFLHCTANARATAFAFLYRVIYEDIDVAVAKADMNRVWQPIENWRDFIFEVLAEHNISPNCESCDWTPMEYPTATAENVDQ